MNQITMSNNSPVKTSSESECENSEFVSRENYWDLKSAGKIRKYLCLQIYIRSINFFSK